MYSVPQVVKPGGPVAVQSVFGKYLPFQQGQKQENVRRNKSHLLVPKTDGKYCRLHEFRIISFRVFTQTTFLVQVYFSLILLQSFFMYIKLIQQYLGFASQSRLDCPPPSTGSHGGAQLIRIHGEIRFGPRNLPHWSNEWD